MPTAIASTTPVIISRMQNRRGTKSEFLSLYPAGYPGTGGCTNVDVLQPGELALCTDTREMFVGNLNGEYFLINGGSGGGGGSGAPSFTPLLTALPPSSIFVPVPGMAYTTTPFLTVLYSVVDGTGTTANSVGINYAKNGELKITAVNISSSIPSGTVTLVDTGAEINATPQYDIGFKAVYDTTGANINIYYMHTFPGNLLFSTSTIVWAGM